MINKFKKNLLISEGSNNDLIHIAIGLLFVLSVFLGYIIGNGIWGK